MTATEYPKRKSLLQASQVIRQCPQFLVADFAVELGHASVFFLRAWIADEADEPFAGVPGIGADFGDVGAFRHTTFEAAGSAEAGRTAAWAAAEAAKFLVLGRTLVSAGTSGESHVAGAGLRGMAFLAVRIEGPARGGELGGHINRRHSRRWRRRGHGRSARRYHGRRRGLVAAGRGQEDEHPDEQ